VRIAPISVLIMMTVVNVVSISDTSCGLQNTSSTLKAETNGIGLSGLFPNSKSQLLAAATSGNWGEVLSILDTLDLDRYRKSYLDDLNHTNSNSGGANNNISNDTSTSIISPLERVSALCHEMTILELAEVNEIDLAYATLRMSSELIDKCLSLNDDDIDIEDKHSASSEIVGMISSRSGDIERRITALSSLRRSTSSNSSQSIPTNYYSSTNSNTTKQKRRDYITKLLKKNVPEIPYKRLASLLGQSIKYQCYTGMFPTVERLFKRSEDEDVDNEGDNAEGGDAKKKKKKKKRKPAIEQKFDLVLGNVDISTSSSKKKHKKDGSTANTSSNERIPSKIYQSIRLGKKSYIESATFLNDGKGLVTGSSDGFIEVWGEPTKPSPKDNSNLNSLLPTEINYEKLRTSDLSYQSTDDLMMHSTSILSMSTSNDATLLGSTSSDGTICIWKISDGKLLRKIQRAHGGIDGSDKGAAVTCIQFSPDGSKVLTGGHDSTCREFGLMSSRMLKEFRGHTSYVNCCSYVMIPYSVLGVGSGDGNDDDVKLQGKNSLLAVVTASADGSVRVWDGRTAEPIHVINPPISTSTSNIAAASIQDKESIVSSKSIHSVIHLHTPANTMIIVPRCDCAYLMSYSGTVLRTYTRDDVQGTEFLAANVSPSNDHLYIAASDGKCVVFDVSSGSVDKIIRSFSEECSSSSGGGDDNDKVCEISGIVCHPHGGSIGGYSNDKSQKRGILTLWK